MEAVEAVEAERLVEEAVARWRRRRLRVQIVVAVLAAAGTAVALVAWETSWVQLAWHVCAAALLGFALPGPMPGRGAVPGDGGDVELEAVEVVRTSGRDVVVLNRHGQRLTWRTRWFAARPHVVPGHAWGSAPVRRLYPVTLVDVPAAGGRGRAGVRWFAPSGVALFEGPEQPSVVVERTTSSGTTASATSTRSPSSPGPGRPRGRRVAVRSSSSSCTSWSW